MRKQKELIQILSALMEENKSVSELKEKIVILEEENATLKVYNKVNNL